MKRINRPYITRSASRSMSMSIEPTSSIAPVYPIHDQFHIQYDSNLSVQSTEATQTTIARMQSIMNPTQTKKIPDKEQYDRIYKPFLAQTTAQMMAGLRTSTVRVQPSPASIRISLSDPNINIWSNVNRAADYFVNIICFGRSFQYLLKYMAYLFHDITPQTKIHVCLFCDEESYQKYTRESFEFAPQRPDFSFIRGFHRHLGNYEKNGIPFLQVNMDENAKLVRQGKKKIHRCDFAKDQIRYADDRAQYALYPEELAILAQLNIVLLHSPHSLMKGVGGKRAVIHWFHALFMGKDDDSHICMTLDDNITGIYQVEACEPDKGYDCSVRTVNKYCRDTDIPLITCLRVYDILKSELQQDTHLLMAGIVKGHGQTSDKRTEQGVRGSAAIYKLNVSRPVEMHRRAYWYNPYFTRFYEDLAFNNELAVDQRTLKLKNLHLQFGHFAAKDGDHDDDFPEYLKTVYHKLGGIEPVYAMYFAYFACLYKAGRITQDFGKIDSGTNNVHSVSLPVYRLFHSGEDASIVMPVNSKYGPYAFVWYMYANIYMWSKSIRGRPSLQTQVSRPSGRLELLNKWVNMNILVTRRDPSSQVLKYAFAPIYQTGIKLVEYDNENLNGLYLGTYMHNSPEYKSWIAALVQEMNTRKQHKHHAAKDIIEPQFMHGLSYVANRTKKRPFRNSNEIQSPPQTKKRRTSNGDLTRKRITGLNAGRGRV